MKRRRKEEEKKKKRRRKEEEKKCGKSRPTRALCLAHEKSHAEITSTTATSAPAWKATTNGKPKGLQRSTKVVSFLLRCFEKARRRRRRRREPLPRVVAFTDESVRVHLIYAFQYTNAVCLCERSASLRARLGSNARCSIRRL